MTKTIKSILLVFALFVFGCDDSDSTETSFCNVASIDDLDWLKQEVESRGYTTPSSLADYFVFTANYAGGQVLYIHICCPTCLTTPPEIRTCGGEVVGKLGVDIGIDQLTNKKTIWRTQNGICP